MAESVKALVMQKLEEVLRGIPELGSVHRWQGGVIDLDLVPLPALYFWEEQEERQRRNRLALGVLSMHLHVYIPLSPAGAASFSKVADTLQGKIHNALVRTAALKGLVENLQEGKFEPVFPNDLWGILTLTFTLTYGHAWGDAFTTAY